MNKPSVRNYHIDTLRGVAIILVLLLHFNLSYHLDESALNLTLPRSLIDLIACNGNYGVTIFFVISGYLITSTSLDRYGSLANINILKFYIFRFARIVPNLLLVVILIGIFKFCGLPIFQNDANTTTFSLAIFSVLTFWHNVLMEKVGYFNYCLNILWSLSVEEIFYLTFPLICICLRKHTYIVGLLLTLIIIAPFYRYLNAGNEIVALYGYLSCFDAIALGCATAILIKYAKFRTSTCKLFFYASLPLMLSVYLYSGIMQNVIAGISLMAFGAAAFIIGVSNINEISINIMQRIIGWFGVYSYELYLFHIIVLALMKSILSADSLNDYTKLIWMGIFIGMSALVANTISKFYAQPMNDRLRSLLLRKRRDSLAIQLV